MPCGGIARSVDKPESVIASLVIGWTRVRTLNLRPTRGNPARMSNEFRRIANTNVAMPNPDLALLAAGCGGF
jgi:hypothetical protein